MNVHAHNSALLSLGVREKLINDLETLTADTPTFYSKNLFSSLISCSEPLSFFMCINEYLFTLNNSDLSQATYNTLKDHIDLEILDMYFDYQLINADDNDLFTVFIDYDENTFRTNSPMSTIIEPKDGQLDLFSDDVNFLISRPPTVIETPSNNRCSDEQISTPAAAYITEPKNDLDNEVSVIIRPVDDKRTADIPVDERDNSFSSITEMDSVEGLEYTEDFNDFNAFEIDIEDYNTIESDDEDIYAALDDYAYDFEDDELDNTVDLGVKDNTISREQRAQQKAIEFIVASEWDAKKYLGLVSDIFFKYGWSATRTTLERLLDYDLTPTELELLFQIKIFWEENDHYWIAFDRVGGSYSYSQYIMSWNSALKIVRSFESYPCIEEIAAVINRLYEVWMSKKVLQRRYWRFVGFVWLWAFETKGFLPTSDNYVFENNTLTPEDWESDVDLHDIQVIRDKERFGLPPPPVSDPYLYWTESRIQQFNQDTLNSDSK